jgi:aspartyl aminopeptidase
MAAHGTAILLPMPDLIADLIAYIDRSPTPYHAVAETRARLVAAGYEPLNEDAVWELAAGDRRFVVRNDGSLVAFEVGSTSPADAGFRIVGAHTDSPNLRLKPLADVRAHGYQQLAVEPYGGLLLHTWLDRDLSLAGRVTLRGENGLESVLVDFERPLLRVPSLAIHLFRELREEGLKLNLQTHSLPLLGLGDAPQFQELLLTQLQAQGVGGAPQVLAFDLMTYDTQPSAVSGSRDEFLHAPRLDNLASCHAGLSALLGAHTDEIPAFTRVLALYDHEEVGSRSAAGAAGPVLEHALSRILSACASGGGQELERALAQSTLVSADMAHAVHPNYADRHEPGHRPLIGGGPVIKTNANQAYATDAATSGMFAALCEEAGVTPQYFVSRSDLGCGSTIGPITAARLGVRTVDVGNPMLSMHSCREMAGTADVAPMIDVLAGFYSR